MVQEALTNARKHAAGRPVTVRLSGTPGSALTVLVTNPLGAGAGAPGSGTGLVGVRERVSLAGGTLDAGPAGDRFSLRASLPWDVA